jgi:hypothetical protein
MSILRSVPAGAWLFTIVWAIYSLCPPFTSYDSYWTVPAALRILQSGTTNVDPFVPGSPAPALAALECVPRGGTALRYEQAKGCAGGHWYGYFPLGVSVLSLPLIAVMKLLVAVAGPLVPHGGAVFSIPQVRSFFAGDFLGGGSLVQLWCASFLGAWAAWLQYRISGRFLSRRWAVGLALLFAFGTSEWSIGSRNLFQHGLSAVLLSAALYLALLARERPHLIVYSSIPLALAFTVRPTNALSVVAFTLFVAGAYRKWLWRFLMWSLPVAVPFLAYNLAVRHAVLPLYYFSRPPLPFWPNILTTLVSPSRGLFVFTPIALFSAAGVVLAWQRRWRFPLAAYLGAVLVAHALVIARWWPGHCYGPRYFADVTPYLIFFLIPCIERWQTFTGLPRRACAALFLTLAAWGVFVHARGATSILAQEWSATPVDVDKAPARVWDWRDPQFLRGL